MCATNNVLLPLSKLTEEYKPKIRLIVFIPIIGVYMNMCPT